MDKRVVMLSRGEGGDTSMECILECTGMGGQGQGGQGGKEGREGRRKEERREGGWGGRGMVEEGLRSVGGCRGVFEELLLRFLRICL